MADQLLQKLSPAWKVYCAEFAATLTSSKALDKSGLAKGYVASHNTEQLVQHEIAYQLREIIKISTVTAARVLDHLAAMMEADIADIYDEFGSFKLLKDWPKVWRQMVSAMETYPTGIPYKVKFVDRLKVIELTGKHVNVAAFEERHTHAHNLSEVLASRISDARQRSGLSNTIQQIEE